MCAPLQQCHPRIYTDLVYNNSRECLVAHPLSDAIGTYWMPAVGPSASVKCPRGEDQQLMTRIVPEQRLYRIYTFPRR